MVIGDEVAEPRGVAVEGELPRADRAVALLGDDHLGFAIGALAAFLPALQALVELVVVLAVALGRLGALNVLLVAVDEHEDVGVLLERAGLAQVGELRAPVLALLDGAPVLREGEDRDTATTGQGVEAARG